MGEDLGSDHLPITVELHCQTPVASDPHKQAQWNPRNVNWQVFSEAVGESVRSFQAQDMNLRPRIRRLNKAMRGSQNPAGGLNHGQPQLCETP